MLMKLTPGDDLPLKLGARVPRIDELRFTLAGPAPVGVRWVEETNVVGFGDAPVEYAARASDMRHDAAPKPGGVPTKAAVKSDIERLVDRAYELHVGEEPARTATGLRMIMDAQSRAMREGVDRLMLAVAPFVKPYNACPGCGVSEGSKHFLSCYVMRPELMYKD